MSISNVENIPLKKRRGWPKGKPRKKTKAKVIDISARIKNAEIERAKRLLRIAVEMVLRSKGL